jgi:hypothetical protein
MKLAVLATLSAFGKGGAQNGASSWLDGPVWYTCVILLADASATREVVPHDEFLLAAIRSDDPVVLWSFAALVTALARPIGTQP